MKRYMKIILWLIGLIVVGGFYSLFECPNSNANQAFYNPTDIVVSPWATYDELSQLLLPESDLDSVLIYVEHWWYVHPESVVAYIDSMLIDGGDDDPANYDVSGSHPYNKLFRFPWTAAMHAESTGLYMWYILGIESGVSHNLATGSYYVNDVGIGDLAISSDVDSMNNAIADANKGNFKATGFSTFDETSEFVMVDSIPDRALTLAKFDTAAIAIYYGFAIWLDDGAANTTSIVGVDGTLQNPVSTLAAARILADSMNIHQYNILNASSFTMDATYENWFFRSIGVNNEIDVGSQDVDNSTFLGLTVTGIQGGGGSINLINCKIDDLHDFDGNAQFCYLQDSLVMDNNSEAILANCYSNKAGNATPTLDFNVASNNVSFRNYSGGINIVGMSSNDNLSIEGNGQVIVDASCSSAPITVRGNFSITDNGSSTAWTRDAVYNWGYVADTAWGNPTRTLSDRAMTLAKYDTATVAAYYDFAIWIDDQSGNTNSVVGVDGTKANPVSTLAAAKILADSMNIKKYYLTNNSSLTLDATYEGWCFTGLGESNQIILGSQDVDNSHFKHLMIAGTQGGTGIIWFDECYLGAVDSLECVAVACWLSDTVSVRVASPVIFDQCYSAVAGNNTPGLDFNSAAGAIDVNFRHYSGGLALFNMESNHTISYESDGQLVVDGTCTSANISARGNMSVTDNGTTTSLTVDAVYNRTYATQDVRNHVWGVDADTGWASGTMGDSAQGWGATGGAGSDTTAIKAMLKRMWVYKDSLIGALGHDLANDSASFLWLLWQAGDTIPMFYASRDTMFYVNVISLDSAVLADTHFAQVLWTALNDTLDASSLTPADIWAYLGGRTINGMASNTIGVGDIANNAITEAAIAADAIGESEIKDDAITSGKLASTAIAEIIAGFTDTIYAIVGDSLFGIFIEASVSAHSFDAGALGYYIERIAQATDGTGSPFGIEIELADNYAAITGQNDFDPATTPVVMADTMQDGDSTMTLEDTTSCQGEAAGLDSAAVYEAALAALQADSSVVDTGVGSYAHASVSDASVAGQVDWTGNEKEQFRRALGITGDQSATAVGSDSSMLDSILELVDAIGVGAGSEPETLHTIDAAGPFSVISNVKIVVRTLDWSSIIHPGAYTDMSGNFLIDLDVGSYVLACTHNNYLSKYDTIEVTSGGGTENISMTLFDPGTPSDTGLCRVYGWIKDWQFNPLKKIKITARLVSDSEWVGVAYSGTWIHRYNVGAVTQTNDEGYYSLDMIPNAYLTDTLSYYKLTARTPAGWIFREDSLTVPTDSVYQHQ